MRESLGFCASGVRRLAKPENGPRFRAIFEDLPPEFTPTHAFYFEGRGGTQRLKLKDLEELPFWSAPHNGTPFDLLLRGGALRGGIHIATHWINGGFNLTTLVNRGLFQDALRLFNKLVDFTDARYAYVSNGGGDIRGSSLNCLPPFYQWIIVLGPEYVELLGRDKLLALDVYKKHEDDAGRLWLQMSEKPEQMHLPEMKEHVKRLMKSLDADDVFCRERRPGELPPIGREEYRRPDFDLSELRDDDPYSTRWYGSGEWIGRTHLNTSGGYTRQLLGKRDLTTVVNTILDLAIRSKGHPDPFGVALAEDGELIQVKARSPERWMPQEQSDMIVERLVKTSESRTLSAVGACFYGKGPVPGLDKDSTAFKIHLESADGDAYVVYLPFDEKNGTREYGVLVVEPGERVVLSET